MNRIFISALAFASLLFTAACSSDASSSSTNTVETATHSAADHAGGHTSDASTYSCPMHPEVTSTKAGEKCPKCGMNLERTTAPATGKPYQMKFEPMPQQLVARQPSKLVFTPQKTGDELAPVPLAVVHEKKIHLIVVSKDLSQFYHEHPEHTAQGSYQVPFNFAKGGEYVLFQDYTPTGASHQLDRQAVTVQGPAYVPVKFQKDNMVWNQSGYQATLSFDKPLQTGQSLGMTINITKGGQPVTDLDNYLGALGHVVIISEDTERYLHVHPNKQTDKGPNIGFHTNFEAPGLYRVFVQFNHGGLVRTGDFTINVQGPATS